MGVENARYRARRHVAPAIGPRDEELRHVVIRRLAGVGLCVQQRKAGERAIGAVYGANTLGSILGVFAAAHLGMPLLGLKGLVSAGAAIDVFPAEPRARGEEFSSELRGLPNVILTPHVGGSTEVTAELDVPAEWEEFMTAAWPKALARLKEISES